MTPALPGNQVVLLHTGPPDGAINVLARAADGTWSIADSGTGFACDDGVTTEACAEIGITHLSQIPLFPNARRSAPSAMRSARAAPFGGRAAPELAAIQSADDLQALAGAIVAELEAQGAEPGQVTVTAADHSPVIVRRSNMDDSLTHTVFTVFAVPITDGGLVVIATRAVDICGRGTTTLDGETVCS